MVVRAKILDNSSSYKITVSQDDGSSTLLLLIIILWTSISAFLCISSGATFGFIYWNRKRKRNVENSVQMYRAENDQTIEMTIKSMQNGYFNSFQDSLNIDTCSICTDRFNEYSLISLTNEWGHVFHTACLKAYYQSSSTPHYLCCPNLRLCK